MKTQALEKAVQALGSKAALARAIGVTPQFVTKMFRTGVPAARCIAVEEATGGKVSRYQLRPDVFGEAPHHSAA